MIPLLYFGAVAYLTFRWWSERHHSYQGYDWVPVFLGANALLVFYYLILEPLGL